MINKDILSQAEIDALLSPLENTEDDQGGEQMTVSTIVSHALKTSLSWKKGDFIPFSGEPFDVVINGALVAQAEVIVVKGKLGIRLTRVLNK